MKLDLTNTLIIALVVIVVIVPTGLYVYDYIAGEEPKMTEYCNANGYKEVYPCRDGSFQSIREVYTEGFRIVKVNGRTLDCPFTLPQYQQGECAEYTTAGMCGYTGDICGNEGACVSDADCHGLECVNWTCSEVKQIL